MTEGDNEAGALESVPEKVRQLWLIPYENPLADRLGKAFFKQLPQAPGVYLMRDATGLVLYVGMSKNLRQRLASYKNAKPDGASRKILRLVQRVTTIEIILCPTPLEARLRENALLREHRPRFNSANTHPESGVFLVLRKRPGGWRVELTQREKADALQGRRLPTGVTMAGAFPGWTTRRGLLGLYRLVWFASVGRAGIHEVPVPLSRMQPPTPWTLCFPEPVLERKFQRFLAGRSPALVNRLSGKSGELLHRASDRWLRTLLEEDAEALRDFISTGTARNRAFQDAHNLRTRRAIGQAQREDLQAKQSMLAWAI